MKLISSHITSVAVSFVLLFPLLTLGQRAPLILSTYRYADNDRIKNIEPFANHLSQTCQCAVVVKSYESVGAMLKAMEEAEPDVVFMNTFGYLLLPEQSKSYTPLAALRVAPDKKSTYQSILVANKSAHVSSLIELQHKASELSLLLVNPGSTSGNLVPRLGLASAGMPNAELVFKKTDYSKNHLLTFQMVAAGNFDVGAFGSEEYDKAIKRDSSLADKVTILWRSGDIPLGPVVYKNNMSPGLKRCLNKALLNLHQNNNAALESVKAGWTEALPADRYVPINKSDYINWLKSYGEESVTIGIIKKFTN